jgi:hypothetical protein
MSYALERRFAAAHADTGPWSAVRGRISELSQKQHGQYRFRLAVPHGARRPLRSTARSRASMQTDHSSGPHCCMTEAGSHGQRRLIVLLLPLRAGVANLYQAVIGNLPSLPS